MCDTHFQFLRWHFSTKVCDTVYCLWISILLMKRHFIVTQQYRVLQKTERTWQIIHGPTCRHVMVLWKYKEKMFFCGRNILTRGMFVTHLSSNVWIAAWRMVWGMTNCRFMSNSVSVCTYLWFICLCDEFLMDSHWSAKFKWERILVGVVLWWTLRNPDF